MNQGIFQSLKYYGLFLLATKVPLDLALQDSFQTSAQEDISPECQARLDRDPINEVVIIQPYYVNTFVAQNTEFVVGDSLTITVDNAPTSFNTIIDATSTSSLSSSGIRCRPILYNTCMS